MKTTINNQRPYKSIGCALAAFLACAVSTQALLIDDFSGDLSAYTSTRILNNGNHNPVNTSTWEISGGKLQLNTSSYTGIEQYALTRSTTLDVGSEMVASYSSNYTGVQDIGLYVGAATPTVDVRQNYVNIYMRNNGQIFSRGFDGPELSLSGGGVFPVTSLFIAHTAADTFELGYYVGGTRNVLTTRTISSGNAAGIGNVIGFYADIRGLGIVGSLDNLEINAIPEPTTFALLSLGGFALVCRARRRN